MLKSFAETPESHVVNSVVNYFIYNICSHYVRKAISPLFAWASSYIYLHCLACFIKRLVVTFQVSYLSQQNQFPTLTSETRCCRVWAGPQGRGWGPRGRGSRRQSWPTGDRSGRGWAAALTRTAATWTPDDGWT